MAQLFSLGIIHTLMKYILPMLTLSLLLTACGKNPSDDDIRQKLVGAWKPNSGAADLITVNADGSVLTKYASVGTNSLRGEIERGTWQVHNGFVIVTSTNADGSASYMDSNKVIRINERECVLQDDEDQTKSEILRKQ